MGKKILVVEDDAAIIETLSIFLRYEGYEVLKATSVEQARSMLDEVCPDLVLLDYMLQDNTAEPVAKHLRLRYGSKPIIVLLTAADDALAKRDLIHANAVVAKPFDLDVLLRVILESFEKPEHEASVRSVQDSEALLQFSM